MSTDPAAVPNVENARPQIRWGLPDALLAWPAGLIIGTLLALPAFLMFPDASTRIDDGDPLMLAVLVGAQDLGVLAVLFSISRWKGLGSLRKDFGLTLHWRDVTFLGVGLLTSFAAGLLLIPLALMSPKAPEQEVVSQVRDSQGPELVVLLVATVILAPLLEEILFRGLLLRALLRKTSPAWALGLSSTLFGVIHLLDVGATIVLPGLVVVGLVAGYFAIRTGDLSRSIAIHAGFNSMAVIGIFVDRSGT